MASKWMLVTILCVLICKAFCQSRNSSKLANFDLFYSRHDYLTDFSLNLTSFLRESPCVLIIDSSRLIRKSYEDFERGLVDYLYGYKAFTLMSIDLKMVSEMRGKNCDNFSAESGVNYLCQKQVIFIIYKTYEELVTSILQPTVTAFQDSSESMFVIVVKSKTVKDLPCRAKNYEDVLKVLMGEVFIQIWSVYKILELSILLPYACGNQTVLRYDPIVKNAEKNGSAGVSIITQTEFSSDQDALMHKYRQLNGYPLEVKLFERVPTLVTNLSNLHMAPYLLKDIACIGYHGGIDGFILGNMAAVLNFSTRVSGSADGFEYGYKMDNGTFTGTIGDVVSRRADIAFNARFLKPYDTDDIAFTYPVYYDQFCVLVPKALKIPTWMNIFQGFSITAWKVTLGTAFICGIVWWLIKIWSPQPERASRRRLACCFYFMDVNLLIASQPILLPTLGRERIFIATCLLFNIIFSSVFQSHLNTAFSTISHYPDINTLEDLDRSGLPIGTSSGLEDIFGSDISDLLANLQKKVKKLKTAAIDEAAYKRDVSCVERRTDGQLLIDLRFLAKDGEPLLHVVRECPRNYHLSYIVYRGYPFLEQMDEFIRRITEAGLNNFWYDLTEYSIVLNEKIKKRSGEEPLKRLSLLDVQTAFFALFIGLTLSTLVLLCEVCHCCMRRKKTNKIYLTSSRASLFEPSVVTRHLE